MSICEGNIVPIVFSEEIATENIKKKYGLYPINDIKPEVNICSEIFQGPRYTTNLTKLTTGMTENSDGVFNISTNDLSINFDFTGNTDTLTAYTGHFQYRIYDRALEFIPPRVSLSDGTVNKVQIFNSSPIYTASTPYSAITTTPFTYSDILFLTSLIKVDQEYILNSNNKFIKNDCLYKGDTYTEPNLGTTYDENSSWYFVTLINPDIPILGPYPPIEQKSPETLTVREVSNPEKDKTYIYAIPQETKIENECTLVNEMLTISPADGTLFNISSIPSPNTLLIAVNGITLSELDYTISGSTIIKLTQSLDPNRDIITASYLDCEVNLKTIYSEMHQVLSAITSGVTSAVTTTDKVYYNTDHGKYEYYTDYVPIEKTKYVNLYLNGVKLTFGVDYYMSTSVNNRIILETALSVSDIIYAVYTSDGYLEGNYNTIVPSTNLEWRTEPTIINDRLNGYFFVEISENNDPDFTSTGVTTGITVNYINENTNYSTVVPDTLEANKSYIWRVTSKKVYSGILDNIFITDSVSRIGKFSTNNTINSY